MIACAVGHRRGTASRVLCASLLAFTPVACAPLRMAPSLVADVQPLRDRGYVLVDSAVGRLDNNAETFREVALDSGGTYVLLAHCDCQGLSVGVAPSSFVRKIVGYHVIPDFLDDAYSEPAPRLRFVVSETSLHLVKLRMSDCFQRTFKDGEWADRAGMCEYGFYLLEEPPAEQAPVSPQS